MKYRGKKYCNAETSIDLENKKVRFFYPLKRYNENLSLFYNASYIIFGAIYGLYVSGQLEIIWLYTNGFYNSEGFIPNYVICKIAFIFLMGIGGMALFGYISLLLHKCSKTARDSYPKTSAIMKNLIHLLFGNNRWNELDLKKKYSKYHYITNNKLYLFDYDIVSFRYKYIGDNKIRRIRTKCVDYKHKNKYDPTEFIAIFFFQLPITDGILMYR